MGSLFWVDNDWALIRVGPDGTLIQGGPATALAQPSLFDLPLAGGLDHDEIQKLDPDGDGVIPLAGGYLLRGNGDQDDNREDVFFFRRLVDIPVASSPHIQTVTNYGERRTALAYKDFGHLKVMPGADIVSIFENNTFQILEGCPCIAGGLSFFKR